MNALKLKIGLHREMPLTEIKASPQIFNGTIVWRIEMNETAATIRKDNTGTWMQHSRDNLSPELIAKIGDAIEECYAAGKLFE